MITRILSITSLLLLLLAYSNGRLFAQDQKKLQFSTFIEVETENDFFYLRQPSDRYYTSGKILRIQSPAFAKGILGFGQLFPLRLKDIGAENYYQFQIKHQLFTPFRIEWSDPQIIDRPYAAIANLSLHNQTILKEKELILNKKIQLGWVGPSIQGEALQNWFHRLKGRPFARGWTFQIADQPVYGAAIGLEKGLINTPVSKHFQHRLLLHTTSDFSNIQGNLQLGFNYLIGDTKTYFDPQEWVQERLHWYAYFKFGGRLLAYNQLLTGTLRPAEDIALFSTPILHHLLLSAEYGLVFQRKRWELHLSQHLLSPEFKTGSAHYWGGIGLRWYSAAPRL